MTIIVVPTERCTFKCKYCFEPENQRAEGEGFTYNFDAIKKSLLEVWGGSYRGSDVCLHGGECLLTPLPELDKLLGLIYNLPWEGGKVKGSSGIMTNGSLITDEHIKLFKKWNTYVGMSVDGPMDLNIYRGPDPSNPLITEEYNKRLNIIIEKLRANNIPVSIICVLHKGNSATVAQLAKLGAWLLWLKKRGITGGRLNPVCSDSHPELELTNYELHRVWLNAYNWNKKYGMQWGPVVEMEKNLLGGKIAPCHFAQCDLFNTHTLSILPDSTVGNCDKTFSHGIYPRSGSGSSSGRYEALQQTECKDCKYWNICGAGCFDDKTEILTYNGFKFFKDLTQNELIATVNPETKNIEYNIPSKFQKYFFEGEMYHWESLYIDLLVTPHHQLYARHRPNYNKNAKKFCLVSAEEAYTWKNIQIPRTVKWIGTSCSDKNIGEKTYPMQTLIKFMGYFLSEGHLHKIKKGGYVISFLTKKDKINEEYLDIIKSLGEKPHNTKKGSCITFCDKDLSIELEPLGKATKKYIPQWIKSLDKESLSLFLDTFTKGDGSFRYGHPSKLYTTSPKLADDLMEVALKCGYGITYNIDNRMEDRMIGKHMAKRTKPTIVIGLSIGYNSGNIESYPHKEGYSGMVYDVTVDNHIIIVRRNRKIMLSGNCPYEGVDGDWRHKARWCDAIMKTYQYIEDKLRDEGKFTELPRIDEKELLRPIGSQGHGDISHGDSGHGDDTHADSTHGDSPHGDSLHGDSVHGDSPDWNRRR